jgi:hypothetical protein
MLAWTKTLRSASLKRSRLVPRATAIVNAFVVQNHRRCLLQLKLPPESRLFRAEFPSLLALARGLHWLITPELNLAQGDNPSLCCLFIPNSTCVAQIFLSLSIRFLPSILSLAFGCGLESRIRGENYASTRCPYSSPDQVLVATLRVPPPAYVPPLTTQFSDADSVKLSDLGPSRLPVSSPTLPASEAPISIDTTLFRALPSPKIEPPTTAKLSSPILLPRTVSYDASSKGPRPSGPYRAMSEQKTGRRRRSSSLLYQEPPETIEHMSDQAALPNLNANWVNAKGQSYPHSSSHGRLEAAWSSSCRRKLAVFRYHC